MGNSNNPDFIVYIGIETSGIPVALFTGYVPYFPISAACGETVYKPVALFIIFQSTEFPGISC